MLHKEKFRVFSIYGIYSIKKKHTTMLFLHYINKSQFFCSTIIRIGGNRLHFHNAKTDFVLKCVFMRFSPWWNSDSELNWWSLWETHVTSLQREREREGGNTVLSSVHSSSSITSLHGSRMRTERARDMDEERDRQAVKDTLVFIAPRSSREPQGTFMSYISELSSTRTLVYVQKYYRSKYLWTRFTSTWITESTESAL